MTRTLVMIALAAAATLGGCEHSERTTESAAITPSAGQSSAAMPAGTSAPAPDNADAAGDALVQDNDRVIAENKRMIALLGRFQAQDFGKYERLRKACEAKEHGTLADNSAPAVARCIEAGW